MPQATATGTATDTATSIEHSMDDDMYDDDDDDDDMYYDDDEGDRSKERNPNTPYFIHSDTIEEDRWNQLLDYEMDLVSTSKQRRRHLRVYIYKKYVDIIFEKKCQRINKQTRNPCSIINHVVSVYP